MNIKTRLITLTFICLHNMLMAQVPQLEWVQEMPGAYKMEMDDSGNFYLVGGFTGVMDMDPSPNGTYLLNSNGGSDIYIAKYNTNFVLVWATNYGTAHNDGIKGVDIDEFGNIYFSGGYSVSDGNTPPPAQSESQTFWPPSDSFFGYVVKISSGGSFLWDVNFSFGSNYAYNQVGSIGKVHAFGNAVYVCGNTPVNSNYSAGILRKIVNGNIIWTTTHESMGAGSSISSLDVDSVGNIIYCGHIYTYAGNPGTIDVDPSLASYQLSAYTGSNYICKLDSAHNLVWANYITEGQAYATGIQIAENGNFYLSGYFNYSVDFNPDTTLSLILSTDGGHDGFLSKYNASGEILWAKNFNSGGSDYCRTMELDTEENIYLSGTFTGLFFDPGSGTTLDCPCINENVSPDNSQNIFISKFDSTGTVLWSGCSGGSFNDYQYGLRRDTTGAIYLLSAIYGPADIDPSPANYIISSTGRRNYLYKLSDNPPIHADFLVSETSVYPGDSIQFTNNSIGNPSSWFWDFGDGSTDTTENPTHAYSTPGLYDITLIISDSISSDTLTRFSLIEAIDQSVFPALDNACTYEGNAEDVAIDNEGNIYTTGNFSGTVDFDPGPGSFTLTALGEDDIFISKISAQNELIWVKQIGRAGQYSEREKAFAIALDESNNIYFSGYFSDTVDFDAGTDTFNLMCNGFLGFICKYSTDGEFIWAIRIGDGEGSRVIDIGIDSQGFLYATGNYLGYYNFAPDTVGYNFMASFSEIAYNPNMPTQIYPAADVFVAKYDTAGNYLWASNLGTNYPTNSAHSNNSSALEIDGNGNILITGGISECYQVIYPMVHDKYLFFAKYNSSGVLTWTKRMLANDNSESKDIACDIYNNIYITGNFRNTIDFDPSSATQLVSADGGLTDAFIAKYNSVGNYIWTANFGGTGSSKGLSIDIDSLGNIYSTGSFTILTDFNPGTPVMNLYSNGSTDVFISKLNTNGEYIWAQSVGGTSTDEGKSILLDQYNNLYIMGKGSNNIDLDPGQGVYANQAAGTFILKLCQDFKANFYSNETTIYLGESTQFYQTSPGAITWNWDFGDGITSSASGPLHHYLDTGMFDVSLHVGDTANVDSITKEDYIHVQMFDVDFHVNHPNIILSETVHFNNETLGEPQSWLWDFGDGTTSTLESPNHTYQSSGYYNVCLKGTFNNYVDSILYYGMVHVLDFQCNFTTSETLIAVGNTIEFINLTNAFATSWYWDFGDGSTSIIKSPEHTYQDTGFYTVSLIAAFGNSSDTIIRSNYIEVREFQAEFSANNTIVTVGQEVEFSDQSIGMADSWYWDFGDGTSAVVENPTHIYLTNGIYDVALTITLQSDTSTIIKEDYISVFNGPNSAGWSYQNTGNNCTVLIPCNFVTINGQSINPFDVIGAFYEDDNGQLVCGGYTVILDPTGSTTVTLWGDDSTSPEKDGFDLVESIQWKIFDESEEITHDAMATYQPYSQQTYSPNGFIFIQSLLVNTISVQSIPLPAGWSIISTYIDPQINILDSVFYPVLDSLIIIKDDQGGIFWPEYILNDIDSFTIGKGYQLKIKNPDTLLISGQPIQPENTPLSLPQGWSFLGYLRNSPDNISALLGSIVNQLVIVKDGEGQIYWPQYGLNSILQMEPGKGYQIKLNITQQFSYPGN